MHSHILPDFDDGARDVDESLALLDSLKKQGVTNVCLTPHFYTNEQSLEDFVNSRNEAFSSFKPHLPDDIKVVLGAEVYVTQYLFNNGDLSDITYGKSRYILTEFAYNSTFSKATLNYIDKLMGVYGLIPILPHVERYHALIDNPEILSILRSNGVIIQTNISNYTQKSPMRKRHKMLKLIKAGLIDILGTDAHSFEHNSPEKFSQAVKLIADKCGEEAVIRMMKKSSIIFNDALNE